MKPTLIIPIGKSYTSVNEKSLQTIQQHLMLEHGTNLLNREDTETIDALLSFIIRKYL